jgi:hypothetical protein
VIIEAPAADRPVSYWLPSVPQGTWFVHAVAVADNADPEPWTRRTLLVGGSGAMKVAHGASVSAPIELRPRRATDLPILLAIPDLDLRPSPHEEQVSAVAVPGR